MAAEEHKKLSTFVKSIHQMLRHETQKNGADKAWQEHCSKSEILQEYATSMQKLASTFWEQNSVEKNKSAWCRINWVVEKCVLYFFEGEIERRRLREKEKFNKIANDMDSYAETCVKYGEVTTSKEIQSEAGCLTLLDVGSCYNPFRVYPFFHVIPIDIAPAEPDVYVCDFLNSAVVEREESMILSGRFITELPAVKMTSATIHPATVLSGEEFRCFVCDIVVSGRYYTLATCRTQSTKIRLIEKLGQLVGERYMVVISEDDIICRGCANLMNTLDRLETEMCSVRNVVLRFLEKKYALEEGELLNNKTTVSCPPPQMLHNTSIIPGSKSKANAGVENFMSRKRKAALMDMENEQKNNFPSLNSKLQKSDPKSNVWMQCDKCKYTTHYNAFMIHHIRQHVKKKNATCDYCGDEVQSGGSCAKQCTINSSSAEGKQMKHTPKQVQKYLTEDGSAVVRCEGSDTAESETVEMITAEINEFRTPGKGNDSQNVVISAVQTTEAEPGKNGVTDESMLSAVHNAVEPATTAIIIDQGQENSASLGQMKSDNVTIEVADVPEQAEGNVEVQLNDVDGSTPTAICVMDMSEDSSAEQPTLLTVQKMEDESSAVYVQVVEVGKAEEAEDARNVTKQVLTVSEDGTVEMVEVMWDEMVSADVGTEQDITFG